MGKRKPALRFKGFEGEWGLHCLNDLSNRYDNYRIPVTERNRVSGNTPYYGANGILDYVEGYTHDGEYILIAEDGANDLNDYPVHYVTGKTWINNHAHVLSGKNNHLDNKFLKYAFKNLNIVPFLVGSCRTKLNADTLMNLFIHTTSIIEQNKVGCFFKQLDALITQQQHKYDSLLTVKKSMLEKMFPKDGADVPEIRFKGFSEVWKQRRLGDQMYIKARIGWQRLTKSEFLTNGDYYLITGTDIDEESHTIDLDHCYYVSKERYDKDENIQVREGDIIVTKDGTIGKVAMVSGLGKPATLNSHLFLLRDLSGKLDRYFLLQLLNSHIFDDFVMETKTGSTLTGMPQKTFVEFVFLIPDLEEQEKISFFFKHLDTLLIQHQKKLDHLNHIKSALLEKMFVSEAA